MEPPRGQAGDEPLDEREHLVRVAGVVADERVLVPLRAFEAGLDVAPEVADGVGAGLDRHAGGRLRRRLPLHALDELAEEREVVRRAAARLRPSRSMMLSTATRAQSGRTACRREQRPVPDGDSRLGGQDGRAHCQNGWKPRLGGLWRRPIACSPGVFWLSHRRRCPRPMPAIGSSTRARVTAPMNLLLQ